MQKKIRLWVRKGDLYIQTLRHLKAKQFIHRALYRLRKPRPDMSAAPPLRSMAQDFQCTPERRASFDGKETFRFLHEDGVLSEIGWDGEGRSKLWRYNQHYFDDLNAEKAFSRSSGHQTMIARWIDENPPGRGSGWEPYPTSLRIVNWIKASLQGVELSDEALQSLAGQTRWLTQKLEWHLLGNHLFVNAKALIFSGLFFDGPEAEQWCKLGFDILVDEFDEQILTDGGQFELSPMYHALALEDVLDLLNVARSAGPASLTPLQREQVAHWENRVQGMIDWLQVMSHPDGRISFFNDAAFGIAPESTKLFDYAERLGFSHADGLFRPAVYLPESGYFRLSKGPFDLVFDAARIGPDYLPGHAHADTLSFELSVEGKRMIVNSGTSTYGTGSERLRQRGTAAHSTLELEHRDSSEVWGGFRVARRAFPLSVEMLQGDGEINVSAAHDGYKRLPGRPIHKRSLKVNEQKVIIRDRVTVAEPLKAIVRFHLHPDCVPVSETEGEVVLRHGENHWQISVSGPPDLRMSINLSSWHPEFGKVEPSSMVQVDYTTASSFDLVTTFSRLPS